MATPESKYKVTLSFKVEEEGKNEEPMNQSEIVWNGLNYAGITGIEALLVQALKQTNEWGFYVAESIGQGEELKKMLEGKPNKK